MPKISFKIKPTNPYQRVMKKVAATYESMMEADVPVIPEARLKRMQDLENLQEEAIHTAIDCEIKLEKLRNGA